MTKAIYCSRHRADHVKHCPRCLEEENAELRAMLDHLMEYAGDWWPDGYEHYPHLQTPILLVGSHYGDKVTIYAMIKEAMLKDRVNGVSDE